LNPQVNASGNEGLSSAGDRIEALRAGFPPGAGPAVEGWHFSPEPLALGRKLVTELEKLGHRLYVFQRAVNEIYHRSVSGSLPPWIASYLDAGKPQGVVDCGRSRPLRDVLPRVIRPGLILTDEGFTINELSHSPGGIGLMAWRNERYSAFEPGWEVIGGPGGVIDGFQQVFPGDAGKDILISRRQSSACLAEMGWLAARLRERGADWAVAAAEDYVPCGRDVYRCYDIFDLENVPSAEAIFRGAEAGAFELSPPHKAFFEEDMWAGLLWMAPLREVWKQALRSRQFETLQAHFPYSWIVDPTPLPRHAVLPKLGVNSWEKVKGLPVEDRRLTLKPGGFSGDRSAKIGGDLSQVAWGEAIDQAVGEFEAGPWLMQASEAGRVVEHPYWDEGSGRLQVMRGRVHLCPNYFLNPAGKPTTRLAGVLATITPTDHEGAGGDRGGILVPCRIGDG
jgi:hypothetical protein